MAAAPGLLARLEARIHPLVAADRESFRDRHPNADVLLFDIPLLYETGAERWLDGVLVVTAPAAVQRARVLARPGMTPEMLDAILARQLPDAEKRARADFVIDTDRGVEAARADVLSLLARIRAPACVRSSSTPRPPGSTPAAGDRIVEIGAVELVNHVPTGRTFHAYVNPAARRAGRGRRVHGLTAVFLATSRCSPLSPTNCRFRRRCPPVIHNAAFDMRFLNAELGWAGQPTLPGRGPSIPWSWPGSAPRGRTASTPCASASASTPPAASGMGRCSTPSCSPRSTSS